MEEVKEVNISEQLDTVQEVLSVSGRFNLQAEVVYWALKYMKENPTITPIDALMLGVSEWVK